MLSKQTEGGADQSQSLHDGSDMSKAKDEMVSKDNVEAATLFEKAWAVKNWDNMGVDDLKKAF